MIRRIQITHTPVFISFSSSSSSSVVKIIQRKQRTLLIIHREFLTNCKKERGRERESEREREKHNRLRMNTLLKDSSLLSISLAFLMLYRMRYIDDSSNLNVIVQYFVELLMEYSHYSYEFNFYYNKVPGVSWIWINLFAMVLTFECSTVFGCLILCTVIILNFMQITISFFFGFNRIRWDFISRNDKKSSKIFIIFFQQIL